MSACQCAQRTTKSRISWAWKFLSSSVNCSHLSQFSVIKCKGETSWRAYFVGFCHFNERDMSTLVYWSLPRREKKAETLDKWVRPGEINKTLCTSAECCRHTGNKFYHCFPLTFGMDIAKANWYNAYLLLNYPSISVVTQYFISQ